MRIFIILTIIGTAIFFVACNKTDGVKPVNTTAENIAIRGFDTVAFFRSEKAVEGNPQYSFQWKDAKWYFSSAENLDLFKQNPEKFAPQFGGYCSWAVSHGYTADGDPAAWKIVDGKLFLNYNREVKEKWEQEQQRVKR